MSYTLNIANETVNFPAEKLGVSLSERQLGELGQFCSILANFNEHTNLVSNCAAEVLIQDHILDSLALLPTINRCGTSAMGLIDIGSGGGFPGLILAIAKPTLKVLLVEATGKKAEFLSQAVQELSLAGRVRVANSRAEILAHKSQFRHQFNLATARAVGATAIVLELAAPFLKPGGFALIQKSVAQCKQEVDLAAHGADKLKSKLADVLYLDQEVLGKERGILLFQQAAKAPPQYPRDWNELKSNPLF